MQNRVYVQMRLNKQDKFYLSYDTLGSLGKYGHVAVLASTINICQLKIMVYDEKSFIIFITFYNIYLSYATQGSLGK